MKNRNRYNSFDLSAPDAPLPIYIISDGTARDLTNRIFYDSEFDKFFILNCLVETSLNTTNIYQGNGFHSAIAGALLAWNIIDQGGVLTYTKRRKNSVEIVGAVSVHSPVCIFMLGSKFLIRSFFGRKRIANDECYDSPLQLGDGPLRDAYEQPVARALLPMLDSLDRLRNIGLNGIMIYALPHDRRPEHLCKDDIGVDVSLQDRSELIDAANNFLKSECSSRGIPFIESVGFQNLAPLSLDYHGDMSPKVSMEAFREGLESILSFYLDSGTQYTNQVHWAEYTKEARDKCGVHESRKSSSGEPLILDLGLNEAAKLEASLKFTRPYEVINPIWNWAATLAKVEHIWTSDATSTLLETMYQVLCQPPVYESLRDYFGFDFMVVSVRPKLSLVRPQGDGEGEQRFHRDGHPVGVKRGMIYLSDVTEDNGPFQYKNHHGETISFTGPPGTLVVFDANDYVHRAKPPAERERVVIDLVFMPTMGAAHKRVVWANLAYWPLDPFFFDTAPTVAFPPW